MDTRSCYPHAMRSMLVVFTLALAACDSCSKESSSVDGATTTASASVAPTSSASVVPRTATSAKTPAPPGQPVGACVLDGDPAVAGTLIRADSGISLGLGIKAFG